MKARRRAGIESETSAPAAARMLPWVDAVVPGANVTMYPVDPTGAGVGSAVAVAVGLGGRGGSRRGGGLGVGAEVGSGVGAAVGSAVGAPTARRSRRRVGSTDGSGLDEASADGAGLCDGSAARTGIGANRAITSRATCVTTRNRIARSRAFDRLRTKAPRLLCQPETVRGLAQTEACRRAHALRQRSKGSWGRSVSRRKKMTEMSAVAPDRAPVSPPGSSVGTIPNSVEGGPRPVPLWERQQYYAAGKRQYRHGFERSIWGAAPHRCRARVTVVSAGMAKKY